MTYNIHTKLSNHCYNRVQQFHKSVLCPCLQATQGTLNNQDAAPQSVDLFPQLCQFSCSLSPTENVQDKDVEEHNMLR